MARIPVGAPPELPRGDARDMQALRRYLLQVVDALGYVMENAGGLDASGSRGGGSAAFKTLSVEMLKTVKAEIKRAKIGFAQVQELETQVAKICTATIETADIQWANILSLTTRMAEIAQANIGRANIGFGQIKDLVTDKAIITQGVNGKLYVTDLAVTEANMVSLTTGALMVKGMDGAFYQITVDEKGAIKPVLVQVEGDNVANATIPGGKLIENTITARELNVEQIFANEAVMIELTANMGKFADLFANEAVVGQLETYVIKSDFLRIVAEHIKLEGLVTANENFKILLDGSIEAKNAKIWGQVEASTGKIGGFEIGNGGLHAGGGDSYVALTATDDNHYMWFGAETADGANFRMNKQGKLFAREAEIYGRVEAGSGKIGDFDIGNGGLHAGSGSSYVGLSAADATYRMWVGAENSGSAPFRVNHAGKMFATDAEISGKVTASSGKIGGFDVGNGGLHAGSGSNYVGLSAADENYYMWFGAEQAANAPFRVTKDGAAYLTRLFVTDEEGVAQPAPVNLNTSYWKVDAAYSHAVKSMSVKDDELTIELYNGTKVNFKKASDFDRIDVTAAGSGSNSVTLTARAYTELAELLGEQVITARVELDNNRVNIGAIGTTANGSYVDCSGIRKAGVDSVSLSATGWVQGGTNTVNASNGKSHRVELPGFNVAGGTSFDSNHKTTVYFSTPTVSAPLKTATVDATSEYNKGYAAGWAAAKAKIALVDYNINGPAATVGETERLFQVTAGGSLNNIQNTAANYFAVNGYAYAYVNGTMVNSKLLTKANGISVGQ